MLPLLFADFANYLDVTDRSEIELDATHTFPVPPVDAAGNITGPPAGGGTALSINFFTQPQVRYRATNRRWEFTLGYLPSLTITDVQLISKAGTLFLQAGQAGVAWIPARHLTLAVNEDVTYGTFNAGVLLPTVAPVAAGATAPPTGTGAQANAGGTEPPPVAPGNTATNPTPMMPGTPVQAQPQPKKITIITSHTAGNVGIQIGRRAHLGFGGGYTTGGGIGTDSQVALPLQYGPGANANFSYALSRRDFVITNATANQTQFTTIPCGTLFGNGDLTSCRPLDQFAALTQGYQHNVERNTALTTQAGVSFVRERNKDGDPFRSVWFPNGLVSLAHKSGTKGLVTTVATVVLAPAVNPLTGAVTNFISGQATLAEPLAARVLLHAVAGGGQGIPTTSPAATTIVQGEVGVAYVLSKRVTLEVGERALWQRAPVVPPVAAAVTVPGMPPATTPVTQPIAASVEPVAFADFFTEVTYFAVTVGAPELRF